MIGFVQVKYMLRNPYTFMTAFNSLCCFVVISFNSSGLMQLQEFWDGKLVLCISSDQVTSAVFLISVLYI